LQKKNYEDGRNTLPKSAAGHAMFMSQPDKNRHCSHFHPLQRSKHDASI